MRSRESYWWRTAVIACDVEAASNGYGYPNRIIALRYLHDQIDVLGTTCHHELTHKSTYPDIIDLKDKHSHP